MIFPLPAPTPFPLPSKPPTFWAFGQCRGWERVGGKGDRELITPPSNPLPPARFFRGVPGKGVLKGALRASIFPAFSPTSPPRTAVLAPGAARLSWVGRRGGRQVRGTNSHPTAHRLNLATPITPPPPPEPIPELSASDLFSKACMAELPEANSGGGGGLGGWAVC